MVRYNITKKAIDEEGVRLPMRNPAVAGIMRGFQRTAFYQADTIRTFS